MPSSVEVVLSFSFSYTFFLFIFYCLIALASTSNTVWSRGDRSGPPRLAPLWGRALRLSPGHATLDSDLHRHRLDQDKEASYYSGFAGSIFSFSRNEFWIFVKCFYCIYLDDHVVYLLSTVNIPNYIDFWMLNQACVSSKTALCCNVLSFLHIGW